MPVVTPEEVASGYTVSEFAEHVLRGASRSTVMRLLQSGKLQAVKVAGRLVITERMATDYLSRSVVNAPHARPRRRA